MRCYKYKKQRPTIASCLAKWPMTLITMGFSPASRVLVLTVGLALRASGSPWPQACTTNSTGLEACWYVTQGVYCGFSIRIDSRNSRWQLPRALLRPWRCSCSNKIFWGKATFRTLQLLQYYSTGSPRHPPSHLLEVEKLPARVNNRTRLHAAIG